MYFGFKPSCVREGAEERTEMAMLKRETFDKSIQDLKFVKNFRISGSGEDTNHFHQAFS